MIKHVESLPKFYRTSVCNNPSYGLYLNFYIDIQKQERARTRCYVTHGIRVRVWLLVLLQLNIDTKINKNTCLCQNKRHGRNNALHCTTIQDFIAMPRHTMSYYTNKSQHNITAHHTTSYHTTLRCTALYCTALPYTTIHHATSSHHTTVYYSILQYIKLHYTAPYFRIINYPIKR